MTSIDTELKAPDRQPFTTFRFLVEVWVKDLSARLCAATFSEVDGLEMSIEPKTIREGGRNAGPVHLVGPVGYGQLSLKRGMTGDFELWKWFERTNTPGSRGQRTIIDVVMVASDGTRECATFRLYGCLPTRLKAPALNAREGIIAIEEMQVLYESMALYDGANAVTGKQGS